MDHFFEVIIAALLGLIAYFLKGRDSDIKSHSKLIQENTLAIIKLNVTLEFLIKRTDEIPELRKDLNQLGAKVRNN